MKTDNPDDYIFINEIRACTILFNLLRCRKDKGKFIIPANICSVVPLTFLKGGAEFEFIDINISTKCIDEEKVLEKISKNPELFGGILYNHSYGVTDTPVSFFKELKSISNHLLIIDDRCLCEPQYALAFNDIYSDIILYSSGYAKYTDIGIGGYAFLKNNIKYENIRLPYSDKSSNEMNVKLKNCIDQTLLFKYEDNDWLETKPLAITAGEYLNQVKEATIKSKAHKQKINQIYKSTIPADIQFEDKFQNWRFNIFVADKKDLLNHIFSNRFFASGHYPSLSKIFSTTESPDSDKVFNAIVNLFNDKYISEEKALQLAQLIKSYFEKQYNKRPNKLRSLLL